MRTRIAALVSGAALACAIAATPAFAANPTEEFSALANVQAQPLTVAEMEAIQGLASLQNFNDLIAAINSDPKLGAFAKKLLTAQFTRFFNAVDGTKFEPLFDAVYNYLQQNRYTGMSVLCAAPC